MIGSARAPPCARSSTEPHEAECSIAEGPTASETLKFRVGTAAAVRRPMTTVAASGAGVNGLTITYKRWTLASG